MPLVDREEMSDQLLVARHEDGQGISRSVAELCHHPTPIWKRTFDVLGSLFLIIALSPILAAIAIYIWWVAGGPVVYRQIRLGEMGRDFTIYKFRTLHSVPNDADDASISDSSESTTEHREYVSSLSTSSEAAKKPDFGTRMIRGGEFIRSHAVDELPQLFNVLFGTMSLVGPRPEVLDWDDYPAWQRRRFEAKPGMTGLWQVSGKNKLTFTEMVDLDLRYIQERSALLDLTILLRTIRVVLSGE